MLGEQNRPKKAKLHKYSMNIYEECDQKDAEQLPGAAKNRIEETHITLFTQTEEGETRNHI